MSDSKKTTSSKTSHSKGKKRPIPTRSTSIEDFPSVADFQPTSKETSLIAYVHDLSEIRRNKGNTADYCSFTLQTSDKEIQEALLFSLTKRPLLLQSQHSHTPIKIKNFTFTDDKSKLVVNDITNISTPQPGEYSFQHAKITPTQNTVTVLDVFNSKKEWDTVTIRGKILSINQPRPVGSPQKRLKLMETVFADQTGSITLDLWESNIQEVKEGAVYTLNDIQVRVWASKKKLSTTRKTTIVEIEDTELANVQRAESNIRSDIQITVNEISTFQKFEYVKCAHCKKKIIQASTEIMTCDQCNYMVRAANCTKGLIVKLVVLIDETETTLTATEDVLDKLLEVQIVTLNSQDLGKKLFALKNISIEYDTLTSRVSSITKVQL